MKSGRSQRCLDENEAVAYLDDNLPAPRRSQVEAHLDGCGDCRRLLSTLAALSADSSAGESSPALAASPGEETLSSGELRPSELFAGDRLEHYSIIRPLGRGGMGSVYLARDLQLGRKVALKVLHDSDAQRVSLQLLAEARTTAALSHPNIVAIYSVGTGSPPYLGLEYVEGQTLHDRVASQGPLSPRETARVGEGIAAALAAAHAAGVLHRDLKPRNVMLGNDGRVRVLDFGLAQQLDLDGVPIGESGGSSSAAPRGLQGTPGYLAPELWRGGAGSPSSDVWALAVVLLHALEGAPPLRGGTLANSRRLALDANPRALTASVAQRAPTLARVLARALDGDPERRPSAREVASTLADVQRSRPSDEAALEPSPFRGLAPFGVKDSAFFFGRDEEIDELLARLHDQPRVTVVGPSGSGKSSLCRAGALPRLVEQGAAILELRPGPRPFARLARRLLDLWPATMRELAGIPVVDERRLESSLEEEAATFANALRERPQLLGVALRQVARAGEHALVLMVDQLEELITLVDDVETRHRFLVALAGAADEPEEPLRLLLTARDDFIARIAEASGDRELLGSLFMLFAPDEAMLAAALRGPLETVGYRLEDTDLGDEMIAALCDERAALPLLQFTAERLWRERDRESKELTRAAYQRIGGVAGALAQHADRELARLGPDAQTLARQLLLRLVGNEETRTPRPRSELLDGLPGEAATVLQRLIDARLLVLSQQEEEHEATVELTHESLTSRWDTLARWIEASREDLRFFSEVLPAARGWERRGRPRDGLWTGDQLVEAEAALRRSSSPPPSSVLRFIGAGADARRWARRRRSFALGLAFVALIAGGLLLARQEREAHRLRRVAEAQRRVAEARSRDAERQRAAVLLGGAHSAFARGDLLEARAKLRAASELEDFTAARALWSRVAADPRRWRRRVAPSLRAIAFSPDDSLLATAGQDHDIYLLDPATAQPVQLLRGHRDKINALALSPDGRLLASAGQGGDIRLWDLLAGTLLRHLKRHHRDVLRLAFSPDGRYLASAGADGALLLWEPRAGRVVASQRHGASVTDLAFDSSGLLFSCSRDTTLRRWRLPKLDGSTIYRSPTPLARLAVHPKRPWLAITAHDGGILLLHRHTGRVLARAHHERQRLLALSFSPDGRWLAAGGRNRRVRLWPVTERGLDDGRQVAQAEGSVRALAFSHDSRWLAITGRDGAVQVLRAQLPPAPDAGHRGPVTGLAIDSVGASIASAGKDRSVRFWDLESGKQRRLLPNLDEQVVDIAYSPEGRLIATGGNDGTVRLWHREKKTLAATLKGHGSRICRLRFSPDGKTLASTSYDRTVRLWDVGRRRALRVLRGHRYFVLDAAFSPDGRTLASCAGRAIRLWDLGRPRRASRLLRGHDFWVYCLTYLPGGELLSGSFDRSVRRWAPDGSSERLLQAPGRVLAVARHRSGRLGTCHSDGTLRIWSATGKPERVVQAHDAEANKLLFSPDGRTMLSAGDDGTVRAFDVATGLPRWFGAALLGRPPRLLDHAGWRHLGATRGEPALVPWQRAAAKKARRVRSRHGAVCMLGHDGSAELWRHDSRTSLARWHQGDDRVRSLLVAGAGCVALSSSGKVVLLRANTSPKVLHQKARALGPSDGAFPLLIATDTRIESYDRQGRPGPSWPSTPGVTALRRDGQRLLVGYRNGIVELTLPKRAPQLLQGTPSAGVRRLYPGPRGTVVVGFDGGWLGLWALPSGAQLGRRHLHGTVEHLLLEGPTLYAASALGDSLRWDLSALRASRCELLRAIWREVPVSWRQGRIHRVPPPKTHPCARPPADPKPRG